MAKGARWQHFSSELSQVALIALNTLGDHWQHIRTSLKVATGVLHAKNVFRVDKYCRVLEHVTKGTFLLANFEVL